MVFVVGMFCAAMEERTARISQRKAAREERNKRREEERQVKLQLKLIFTGVATCELQ